jgi:hypothetical protein
VIRWVRHKRLEFFLNTLAITPKWMITAEEKLTRSNAVISPDRCGSYQRQHSLDTIESNLVVKEHIYLFPKLPSHLCRTKTTKLCLKANLNQCAATMVCCHAWSQPKSKVHHTWSSKWPKLNFTTASHLCSRPTGRRTLRISSTRKRKVKTFVFCDDLIQTYDGKLPIKTEKFNDLQVGFNDLQIGSNSKKIIINFTIVYLIPNQKGLTSFSLTFDCHLFSILI